MSVCGWGGWSEQGRRPARRSGWNPFKSRPVSLRRPGPASRSERAPGSDASQLPGRTPNASNSRLRLCAQGNRLQADPAAPDTTIIEKCALRDSQPEGCGMTFITFLVTLDTMWDDDPHPAFVSIGTNRDSLLGFPLAVPGRCRGTETGVPVSPRQTGPVPNRVEAKLRTHGAWPCRRCRPCRPGSGSCRPCWRRDGRWRRVHDSGR
jgi:hypothetical protein